MKKDIKTNDNWKNEPEVKVKPVICEFCKGGLVENPPGVFKRCEKCNGTGKTL